MYSLSAYAVTNTGEEVGGGHLDSGSKEKIKLIVLKRISDAMDKGGEIIIKFEVDPYYDDVKSCMYITKE